MSISSPAITTATAAVRPATSLRRTTAVVGVAAATAITVVAATVHAAGVPLAVDGEMIPLAGFAQMTLLGAVIGGLFLAGFNRRSTAPRRRFVQTAAVLTALSCVPSIAWASDDATRVALVAMHLLAAAIIVPVLVHHAHD